MIATFDFVVIGISLSNRKPTDKENGVVCNTTPFLIFDLKSFIFSTFRPFRPFRLEGLLA